MNTTLTAPIVVIEHNTSTGPRCGPPVAVPVTDGGLREMRKAYWNGEPWGADGGRILVLIEDPFGVLPTASGGAK